MLNENIKKLLGEDSISEEVATKLFEMIDSRLQEAVDAAKKEVKDEMDAKLEEKDAEIEKLKDEKDALIAEKDEVVDKADAHVKEVKEEMEARTEKAIEEAVNSFIAKNSEAIKNAEKFERMNAVFESVKKAFEQNGFVLDNEEPLNEKEKEIKMMVQAYDELFEETHQVKDKLEETTKRLFIVEATKDLSEFQKDLVEKEIQSVEFLSEESYKDSLNSLVEKVSEKESEKTVEKDEKTNVLKESVVDERTQKQLEFMSKLKWR